MPIVAFSSPKGGVGKTTLAAHVAIALRDLGWNVVAMDFDSQNSLRLPFGMPLEDDRGYVQAWASPAQWPSLALPTTSGVHILPYGTASEADRLNFEANLLNQQDYLLAGLAPILRQPGWVIVADLPPGPVPALKALEHVSAVHIAVLLADATSLSLLPQIEQGPLYDGQAPFVILNQVDARRRLSRSVTDFVTSKLGDRLIGKVSRDEAVAEAVGWQRSVFEQSPASAAGQDFRRIARTVSALLQGGSDKTNDMQRGTP